MDAYRVEREWLRYEGTPLRELFRELRERFLRRHTAECRGWVLDAGSGPGRFSAAIGPPDAPRVLLDLARTALKRAREISPRATGASGGAGPGRWEPVRGDALRPPFVPESFGGVVVLGNLLGFAAAPLERPLRVLADLVAPGGMLVVEVAPGPGERSVYLHRLPPSVVRRILRAPSRWLEPRIDREGFERLPARRPASASPFRRWTVDELIAAAPTGFTVEAVSAVAPLLGSEPERLEPVRADPISWERLLAMEEHWGSVRQRWSAAASALVAFRRAGPEGSAREARGSPQGRSAG
ncbi:MAG: class I SAM-dependent methyltransferase [Thermoplasmata archaeon]